MKGGFISYFTDAPEVSSGKKVWLVVLGILLSLSLLVFGPVLALHQTVFNPDCIASYVDDIDVASLAKDWLNTNVVPKDPLLAKTAEVVVVNFEPQIKYGMKTFVHNTYALILDSLEKNKLLQTVEEQRTLVVDLASNIQAVLDLPVLSPVFYSLGVTADSVQKYINIDQINGFFNMIDQLQAVKDLVVGIMISFVPLLIISLALIIAVKLIGRRPVFISGELGLIFTTCGALQFAFLLPDGSIGRLAISQFNLPPLVQGWLLRLITDFANIIIIYGSVLLLVGVALIVLYYFLKKSKLQKRNT